MLYFYEVPRKLVRLVMHLVIILINSFEQTFKCISLTQALNFRKLTFRETR